VVFKWIHHHYSSDKIKPDFQKHYLETVMKATKTELESAVVAAISFNDEDSKR
jgi:dipeptidyl-peptidase-3